MGWLSDLMDQNDPFEEEYQKKLHIKSFPSDLVEALSATPSIPEPDASTKAGTAAPAPISAQNPLLEALNSMTAESSTPFVSPRMEVVNAGLDDYQKSMGDSELQQIQQIADLLPPAPKEGIYTRADKAMGGVLPFGVPIQREEGFPGMENYIGGGPEAPPVFEDDPVMKSLAMGLGDVLQSTGGAAKWMGAKERGDKWVQSGQEIIDANQLTPGTPGEFGVGLSAVRSAPFFVSLLPASLLGGGIGAGIGTVAGASNIGTAIAGAAGAAAFARPLESIFEAGGVYNEALEMGMEEEQAANAAKETFLKNLPLAVTDFMEIGFAFLGTKFLKKPLGKALGEALESKFGKNVINPAVKVALPVFMEGEEENIQEIIQQQALGDRRGFIEQYMNPTEAQQQGRAVGQLMGGLMGGAGIVTNLRAGQTPPPEVTPPTQEYTPPPLMTPVIEPPAYSGPVLGNIERPGVEPPPATPPDALSGTESGPPSGLPPAGPASGGEVGPAGKAPHMAGIAQAAEMPTFKQWAEKEYGDYSDFSKGMMETAKARYDKHITELAEIAKHEVKDIPNEFEKIYYRGEKTGETKKISTGVDSWDNNLFVANSPKSALAYGDKVERIALKKNSKVLIEGSKEYKKLVGNKKYKKTSDEYIAVLGKAKEQGYDVVEFNRQTDIGTVILNENSVVRNYLPESTTPPPPLKTGQAGTIVPAPEVNVPQTGEKVVEGAREAEATGGRKVGKATTKGAAQETADSIRKAFDAVTKMYMDKYGLSEAPEQPILAAEVADEWGKTHGVKSLEARKKFKEAVAELIEEGKATDIEFGNVREVKNSLGRINVGGKDIQLGTVYVRTKQQAKQGEGKPAPALTGKNVTAKTERGTSIEVQYAVVSADDLIASHNTDLSKNEAYPEEIQPRQRERAASEEQINRIAANLEPEFLGESPKASEGAPIVGPDLVVESGNGRVIALQRAFKSKKESAGKYQGWLADNAEKFGIDKEALRKVGKPVLVRIRQTEVDRVKFAQEANEQSVASMSATEQAKADATKLDSGILNLFVPSETGEIHRLANADFVRSFMDKVVGPAEKGRYVTGDGVLSQEGIARIKNAIFAKAYDDITAIAILAESTDNNVKNITNAMLIAAPKLAKVKEGIESGNLYDLDISNEIAPAIKKLSHLRDIGESVDNYLNQVAMFGQELSDLSRDLLDMFNKNKRHAKRIAGVLSNYADSVVALGDPKQVTMFSKTNPTKAELLLVAIRKVEKLHGKAINETSLFQDQATGSKDGGKHPRKISEGAEAKGQKPYNKIADFVTQKLKNKEKFTSADLFREADKAYGGGQAQGKYTPKDAYDAMELGVNRFLEDQLVIDVTLDTDGARNNLMELEKLLSLLPTQTKRTAEQDEFQQFSTPPNLAYAAAWAANLNKGDTVLEPSAGIGGLAVFAKKAGAEIAVNELSKRRLELLKEMGFDEVFNEDAEQIDNILPDSVKPTVVIMNPPFSATAGRMEGKRSTKFAEAHIEQALLRLEPGGRLVAIVGRGMSDSAATFKPWWKKIKAEYNVRANIGIDGSNYKKYGTSFDVQLLVIDKTGATPEGATITGSVTKLEDVLPLLEVVRNDRTVNRPAQQTAGEPTGEKTSQASEAEAGPGFPISVSTTKVGAGDRGSESTGGRKSPRKRGSSESSGPSVTPEPTKGHGLSPEGRPGERESVGEAGTVGEAEETSGRGGVPTGQTESGTGRKRAEPESGIKVESQEAQASEEDLSDAVFTVYTPQKLKIPGAVKHPGHLAQSAAMAAVEPPNPTYTPNLPKEVIKDGKLSIAQLESIVYAGQAHQQTLPDGQRRGFFIGDGTGVGKGREISGIIMDNMRQGRKKAVWISKNNPLFNDAKEHFEGAGGNADLLFALGKVKQGTPIKQKEGVLFTTYNTVSQNLEISRDGEISAKKDKKARIDQIVDWLGKDFDGVIAFDEAHQMQNSLAMKGKRGMTKPSVMALAGVELQKRLPNARIVYASATGATEVANLAYADRLGLWGEGTPFSDKRDFVTQIQSGGLAAMELVARDMKAMGVYMARNLSFDGVTYGTIQHELSPEQLEIYDTMAEGWQAVLQNIHEALEVTGQQKNGNAKASAMSAFWGSQQRFFNQILTSMQMPSAIEAIKKDLKDGHAVVMQLVNTNEAAQNRQISKMEEDDSLEDLDLTPRDMLMQYIDKSFPTQQYEEYTDDNGNVRTRPVFDSQGRPVQNRKAVAMKERLLDRLGSMKVPEGPLELILNTFGAENVAEITGRSRRVIKVKDESGQIKAKIENRTPKHAEADANAFMNDKKKILVFSDAGGTGRSYHASLMVKNQRRRIHYLIQPGWRADSAVQGFGRTHRTNQANTPHYVLVTTGLKGQKRFISSIARRLDQLGALTKGQRQTGSQGLFSAKDNLESGYAKDALQRFYEDLVRGQIKGFNPQELLKKMGLDRMLDEQANMKESPELRDITKFLNRILALESDLQNRVFDAFSDRLDVIVERAMESGTLDAGLENFRADKVKVLDEKAVYTDENSGAETNYVELEASYKNKPLSFSKALKLSRIVGIYQNTRSGRVYAVRQRGMRTTQSGSVVYVYELHGQSEDNVNSIDKPKFDSGNWEEVKGDEAKKLWNEALDKLPEYRTQKVHLITGAILPIWDRLPGEQVRVIRVKTDDGKVMLGRIIPEKLIDATLSRLDVQREKQQLSPAQIVERVIEEGYSVNLANNWRMVRKWVSGEHRIEIIGNDLYRFTEQLKKDGVFTERIQFNTRYFIPTGEGAADVFAKVTRHRPVVEVVSPDGVSYGTGRAAQAMANPTAPRGKADAALANNRPGGQGESSSGIRSMLDVHSPQKTSIKQVAAGLKIGSTKGIFKEGMTIVDMGGGLWEEGTEYLAGKGITNLVYDPYARTKEHNDKVIKTLDKNGGADAAALNNVLNVIPTTEERADVLKYLYQLMKPGCQAVITVYEGNKSGKGGKRVFGDGTSTWQENRRLASYEEEIRKALPGAELKKRFGAFVLTKPEAEAEKQKVQAMANPVQPPAPKNSTPTKDTIRRKDIIRFLNAKLAPIRTGRFRVKALGIFKVKPEVIRTRIANDLPTISHEIGHYLDKRLDLSKNHAYDQELITLGHPQSKKSYTKEQVREEGIAEFIRLYLTDPQQAKQEAPNYFAAFEDVLDVHTDIKDILLTVQKDIELWYNQPAEARVAGAISVGENNSRKMTLDRLYSLTVDELDPLKRFTEQIGGKDVPIDKNPFLRAWLARGWNGKAETLLHYGVMNKNGKKIGKSLDEVLAPVKDELDSFRSYTVAKHSLEVTAQGKHTGILDADAQEVVDNAPQKYQDVLGDLVEYQDALLGLLVEAGVMKAESVTTMREMYPNYVPFYRVFDEDVNTIATYMSKGGFANLHNPVKALKGSARDIIDPIESIIKNTYTFVNIAERNVVGRTIVKLAESKEGTGQFVEKVDARANVSKENILTVYVDGKALKYQLDPDLYRATLALDREASNILIKILSYPASWLRAGATLSPDFMIRNPVRDQFSAFINSKYGYIPGIDLVKGIFHAVKKDELYWQFQNSGAAHSSLVALDREYLQRDIKKFLKNKTAKEKALTVINPGTYIEMLRALSEFGEYGTRLGEFAKGVKKGASFEEAALSARDLTLDFARVGTHMKHANRVIAFMNATIQGSDKIVRQFRANPKSSIIKTMAAITLPSIILFLLNHDDDRYKELPQWQKDIFWIVLTKDHIFRIPKPFELGILFGTVPERILAWAADKDPKAFKELGNTLKDAIAPGYVPTAMLPIIEVWANKSTFTGRPIVPEREKYLDPKYQFGPYTVETAKAVGDLLNWSPRKIESFLRGYTGGLGLYTVKLIEGVGEITGLTSRKNKPALAVADYPVIKAFMVKEYASPQSVEDFYSELNDLEKKWSSSDQVKQILINQEEYDRLKLMRKVAGKLSEIRKAEREIQNSKDLTPGQKRRALENADKLTVNFARAAMGKGAVK